MKNIRTILFDADDTLWHDSIYFQKVQNFIQKECLSRNITKEVLAKELNTQIKVCGLGENGFAEAIINTANNLGFTLEFIEALNIQINEFLSHPIELFPGVADTLCRLDPIQKILLTKGKYNEQINKLLKSNLLNYFDNMIVLEAKNTKNLHALLELFNLKPKECLLIGNSIKHDIIPAKANELNCIWFNHELNTYGQNEILPPNVLEASNWNEIYQLISEV